MGIFRVFSLVAALTLCAVFCDFALDAGWEVGSSGHFWFV